ncbi:CPG4 domain-containing protein [Caenorhabditis elegans]|uniref:CPG4 domain-containing protein n=1 Tax=Caenorhabditis elegans TaxID=6239 RepID=O01772_CAEEL|nr:CPG4 domain-containing protein [Caenorhabditis elegans]CCD64900.1 CPG4 domain-containing protein [Caenorhabditis elegans]|eukprot:NP_491911.3 Uncharacterized protein CELE_ZC581.3 [Caenorhabditis elegans]
MIRFSVFLFLTTTILTANAQNSCEDRCTRLKQRSLSRIGYDDERLQTLFERQRPIESMKDVCWRLYDNLDCMKKCPKSEKHAIFAKHVRNKCKFVLSEMEPTLKCISKHHSFLTMRCSSFLNEASRLRAESDLSTTPRHDECRFLHLTTICLENHVNTFCPDGRKIFKRLNFRDYFLSFVLPMDDDLFDDEDLDSCQIYDFVKDAEKRERENEERKQEEERRRRIDDDEDYEEELTTIVNDMEDDSSYTKTSTMPTEETTNSLESTSSESFTAESTSSISPILGTLESIKQEDFTTLLDDLITSAERDPTETVQRTSEINGAFTQNSILELDHVTSPETSTSESGNDDLDAIVNNLDEDKQDQGRQESTQLISPSTSTNSLTHLNDKTEEDVDHNAEYHDYTDHHYDEDHEYHDSDNTTHPTISVVSIETRLSESDSDADSKEKQSEDNALVEVTTPDQLLNLTPPNIVNSNESEDLEESGEEIQIETTTLKRKVFSEDSMENTPPNFFYSSNRYDSTTRSNYVADNLDLEDSEEPLEIDTSTLFGVETTSNEIIELSTSTISYKTTETPKKTTSGKPKPWLHGGVIVKPILNFDQLDVDQDEQRERENRRQEFKNSSSTLSTSETSPTKGDDLLSGDSGGPSTNETLIVIGLIALVTCLIFLVLLLLLAYFCSTRTDSYNVHKDEGSPPV